MRRTSSTIASSSSDLNMGWKRGWRLCTKTTRRCYLWSVDSSHVELAVRRFMFGRWFLALRDLKNKPNAKIPCYRSGNGPYYNCPSPYFCLSEFSIPNGMSRACGFKVCMPIGLYACMDAWMCVCMYVSMTFYVSCIIQEYSILQQCYLNPEKF